jgi:chromosome segregation ATPase
LVWELGSICTKKTDVNDKDTNDTMTEKGHFEKGVWVIDNVLPAPQANGDTLDRRLAEATKAVISSIDTVMNVTHDLVTTEEGKQFIETTIKETQKQIQMSFNAILNRAKSELDKTKVGLDTTKADLGKKVAEPEKIKADLGKKVEELEKKVAEPEKIKAELDKKVAELKKGVAELEKKVAEPEKIKAELDKKVVELKKGIAELAKPKAVAAKSKAKATKVKTKPAEPKVKPVKPKTRPAKKGKK